MMVNVPVATNLDITVLNLGYGRVASQAITLLASISSPVKTNDAEAAVDLVPPAVHPYNLPPT